MERKIAPVVHIQKLSDPASDFAYWQQQSYESRITALEEMRREYYAWLSSIHGNEASAEPGMRKVCRIIKLSDLGRDN
jgi:hypothetical protein